MAASGQSQNGKSDFYTCSSGDRNIALSNGGFSTNKKEASPRTSITTRVEHVNAQGRYGDLKASEHGSVAGSSVATGLEESIWLRRSKIDGAWIRHAKG